MNMYHHKFSVNVKIIGKAFLFISIILICLPRALTAQSVDSVVTNKIYQYSIQGTLRGGAAQCRALRHPLDPS